jgi:hypothetical protein
MERADLLGNRSVPFNSYAAGKKHYGAGRTMPNIGPVGNKQGYAERDNKAQARKNAIMRRMKGMSTGNPMNKDVISGS